MPAKPCVSPFDTRFEIVRRIEHLCDGFLLDLIVRGEQGDPDNPFGFIVCVQIDLLRIQMMCTAP